ncbi:MAG: hypothetical protein HYX77_04330 [Acidobacteria bacterium]|nr:hypothetical protein [Acidobacteriota bacterium]
MSITTTAARDDEHAEPWRQWQLANAKSNRKAAIQARIGFAFILTAAGAWLGLQLLSSPAWR